MVDEIGGPVRSLRSFRRQRYPGWYWSATLGRRIGFESWVARDHLVALDFDPEVVDIVSQPFWLVWCDEQGKQWRHAPDFLVRLTGGHTLVLDSRSLGLIGQRDRAGCAVMSQASGMVGWEHIARRIARCIWGAGGGSQVTAPPTLLSVPPQFMDVAIHAAVDHVLGALSIEHVARRIARRIWGAGEGRQVIMPPAADGVPPQLMDVAIHAAVDHVLGAIGGRVPRRIARRTWGAGEGRQVIMPPAADGVPPQLMQGVDQLFLFFAGHGLTVDSCEAWLLSEAPSDASAAINVPRSKKTRRKGTDSARDHHL